MRTRRSSVEHAEAVARRLALLAAEVEGAPEPAAAAAPEPATPPPAPEAAPASAAGWELPRVGRHRAGPGYASARAAELRDGAREEVRARVEAPLGAARGLLRFGSAQVAVLACLVAAGLVVAAWWVVRADPDPLPTVLSPTSSEASGSSASALEAVEETGEPDALVTPVPSSGDSSGAVDGADAGEVVVDVAGRVRRPGIAVLPAGSRVADALEAAGGARPGVDLTSLNLARVLVDGEQVLVGVEPAAGAAASALSSPGAGDPGASGGGLVNLNTADQATLETLPQVGPVTAASILAWRDEHGGFTSVDELLEVDGIGEATLAQIAPHVTV
ncbi:helix-hairpin-helix domain-containing protein [Nocardioides bruguierae]|uniref:helix-hairpin-helix domain-containing protein n=1 Tax=Nocardioides bruguierae TaxID=2945102 RepID=UPI0020225C99|nr:ComEA family DNA-binding protein [Nocardioides bruguierae]MCL8024694.1 ComEA family DNA-binding protein [Nocardioides bruguierae]